MSGRERREKEMAAMKGKIIGKLEEAERRAAPKD